MAHPATGEPRSGLESAKLRRPQTSSPFAPSQRKVTDSNGGLLSETLTFYYHFFTFAFGVD